MSGNLLFAYRLNDGGASGIVKSESASGADAVNEFGVWMKSETFSKVLDFSTAPSSVRSAKTEFSCEGFTLSAWINAPKRVDNDRVIVSGGGENGFKFYIEGKTGALFFESRGIVRNDFAGRNIVDGKWHHVAVAFDGKSLIYYVDSVCDRTVQASGRLGRVKGIFIGTNVDGFCTFDGRLAEVRMFSAALPASKTTSVVLNEKDNELPPPIYSLKRGIHMDRPHHSACMAGAQEIYSQSLENVTINKKDAELCARLGFDHISLMLIPNNLIDGSGSLVARNMYHFARDVDIVLESGLRCVITVHPEYPFNERYLVAGDSFKKLLNWYGELAHYISKKWPSGRVALCAIDMPCNNTPEAAWFEMAGQIWSAVRNAMPEHMIIIGADRGGDVERLRRIAPANDPNTIYSITHFEPYTAAYNSAITGRIKGESFWNYLSGIPYPVPKDLSAHRLDRLCADITENVPASLKKEAQIVIGAYLRGEYDSNPILKNNFDVGYGREWHLCRMARATEWIDFFGGRATAYVGGFGCIDSFTARRQMNAHPSAYFSPAARINLIRDMREAFDYAGIGWNYWSFNGLFTLFDPARREYMQSHGADMLDLELTLALGLELKN